MQLRTGPLEEGKEATVINRTNQSKALPFKVLQLLVPVLALCIAFSVISIYTIRHFGNTSVVTTVASTVQPCHEEQTSLEQWIRPPLNLIHAMTDKELLWRASFAPRIREYPFQRVPKIAFMFLTKGPLPLAPLWEKFLKGHEGRYSIYVHSLPSFQANFPPSSVFYRKQIPSQVLIFILPFFIARLHILLEIWHLIIKICASLFKLQLFFWSLTFYLYWKMQKMV